MSNSNNYGRPPPKTENMFSLKVDNLTYRTTPEDLRRVFERCGEVGDIYIPRDRNSRESRGFAFVRFYDKRDAEDALDAMDGRMLDGRELRVQMARYGRPTSPQRRDRGGGRYNDRRRGYGNQTRSFNNRNRSRSPRERRERRRSRSRSAGSRGGGGGGGARKSYSRSKSRSNSRSDSKSSRGKDSRSRSAERPSRSASRE